LLQPRLLTSLGTGGHHDWQVKDVAERCIRKTGECQFMLNKAEHDLHIVLVFGRKVVPGDLEETNLMVNNQERSFGLIETLPGVR
jgi:hypothetical protein